MQNIYFKERDLKKLLCENVISNETRKRIVSQMAKKIDISKVGFLLGGPKIYLGDPIRPIDHEKAERALSGHSEIAGATYMRMTPRERMLRVTHWQENTKEPFSKKYIFYKWRKLTIAMWMTFCRTKIVSSIFKTNHMERLHVIPLLTAPWTVQEWNHVVDLLQMCKKQFRAKINEDHRYMCQHCESNICNLENYY